VLSVIIWVDGQRLVIVVMRCLKCSKTHVHSNKGITWTEFQLCKKCYKNINGTMTKKEYERIKKERENL
tara:strand:- start:551 stop:757 length:207 start_codon:yes stop_codon:yes gene_type:complete